MKIQLIDQNKELVDAWQHYFGDKPDFKVVHGNYFSLPADVIISPANSFGFMDGGIDQHISNYFKSEGINIQKLTQDVIRHQYGGELLVGQCAIIPSGSNTIPFMLCVPTMRVPMPITDAVDVYLAARAIFRTLKEFDMITVSICGLGTGIGLVKPVVCAHKMYQAYERHCVKDNYFPSSLFNATEPHQHLGK